MAPRKRFVQVALRKGCWSFREVLCILVFYLKSSIMQPELQDCTPRTAFALKSWELRPRTTFAHKSCDFCLEKLAGIEPTTVRLREQPRKPRDNFQRPVRKQQIRTAPQRERFDTHDPRRGFIGHFANSHGAAATALRPRRSPQRVAREPQKSQKVLCFLTSTTPISAQTRAHRKNRRKSSVFE